MSSFITSCSFFTELSWMEQKWIEMEVLQQNYSLLCYSLSPDDVLPELFSNKLITQAQMDKVETCKGKYSKNGEIVRLLREHPSTNPLQSLCSILQKIPAQESIAEKLMEGTVFCTECEQHTVQRRLDIQTCACDLDSSFFIHNLKRYESHIGIEHTLVQFNEQLCDHESFHDHCWSYR